MRKTILVVGFFILMFISGCATIAQCEYKVVSHSERYGKYHYWIVDSKNRFRGFEYVTDQEFKVGETIVITNIK